jgi:hypothetical protein
MGIKSTIVELNSFLPLEIWRAEKGYGSFLIFDLGKKVQKSINNKTFFEGSIRLWIYLCKWYIWKDNKQLLCSDDEDVEQYEKVLKLLIKKSIISINEVSQRGNIDIVFNDGFKLQLSEDSSSYNKIDDLMIIYINDSYTIAYSVKNGFYKEPVEEH